MTKSESNVFVLLQLLMIMVLFVSHVIDLTTGTLPFELANNAWMVKYITQVQMHARIALLQPQFKEMENVILVHLMHTILPLKKSVLAAHLTLYLMQLPEDVSVYHQFLMVL